MGDRTFTAEDVIRIYELYLDEREMQTVEDFFQTVEEEEPLPSVSSLLGILENLLGILAGPFIGAIAATFSIAARNALNAGISALANTNRILGRIVEQEEVDA